MFQILDSVIVNNSVGAISQNSSENPFKLFRFNVGLSHLEKLTFVQASACIAFANAKKSKEIFGPSAHRAKNQSFRKPTNHIPLDPEFYASHYLQKDYTLKINCNKGMTKIRWSSDRFL